MDVPPTKGVRGRPLAFLNQRLSPLVGTLLYTKLDPWPTYAILEQARRLNHPLVLRRALQTISEPSLIALRECCSHVHFQHRVVLSQ